ncbi:hypothetical protein ISN45_At03g033250 [Arabidopsis thaliana x Arabidopsis arenosa]|uniref:Uncharacterized protein n=2 Tax=Arabidopsis TaxID=3701 RepID=A0A178V9G4_ARATH|nr:hypothetical protein ISN45_At03g033250 [Arabidopsis thaliana x Arabidopsis arenosa]OAP02331.1 hypothetical protein AXX17_AT3G35310 [Arabidopsis thaliana]
MYVSIVSKLKLLTIANTYLVWIPLPYKNIDYSTHRNSLMARAKTLEPSVAPCPVKSSTAHDIALLWVRVLLNGTDLNKLCGWISAYNLQTWPPNVWKTFERFWQVSASCFSPQIQIFYDLEGLRAAPLQSVESLLLQPSSFIERTMCMSPSFMEKTFSPWMCYWFPVSKPRDLSLILTSLLYLVEEVMCLVPARLEVLDSLSTSQCQLTNDYPPSSRFVRGCGFDSPSTRMWQVALPCMSQSHGSAVELSYLLFVLINVFNVVLLLALVELLIFVILFIF